MDRDELKIKVRDAIWNLDSQSLQTGHWEDPLTYAEAALTAIEDAGWMPVPTKVLDRLADFNAVWDEAVEACIAQIKEYGDGQNSSLEEAEDEGKEGPTLVYTGATMAAAAIIDRISSLKLSDKTESDNGGCQVSSGAKGDTVSAAPLHSDIIAEAVRKVSWQPEAFNVRRDENGQIFVSADGHPIMDFPPPVALELGEALVTLAANSQSPSEEAQRADTMPLTSGETPDTENQDADFPAVEPVTEKQDGS